MAKRESHASVSDWMVSVATVLPHPRRAPAPYTLGEAVAEVGAYAESATAQAWRGTSAQKNRDSLRREIEAQHRALGKRLSALVDATFVAVHRERNRTRTVHAAAAFDAAWRSTAAVTAAFEDLCTEAKDSRATVTRLRELAELIASQLGTEALGYSSPLRDAAEMLGQDEENLSRRRDVSITQPLNESERVQRAHDLLVESPTGRVVVWAAYTRATVWGIRTDLGSITVLRPDWALPNAFDENGHDFDERAELREMRDHVPWLEELYRESTDGAPRLVLVRVDLGDRKVAGASDDARRLIHALLAVPVRAGGVSWQETGTVAVLLDGVVQIVSGAPIRTEPRRVDDSYGVGATAEILHDVESQLGSALRRGPMPNHLIEALSALREARMTDHRDVQFYGARPVSPRFATALEDHAMELIASVLAVRGETLATAMELRFALQLADTGALSLLMSPFEQSWNTAEHSARRTLEDAVSHYDGGGTLIVDISSVLTHLDEIRALPMTALQRANFEFGVDVCTDPKHEKEILVQAQERAALLRARHRRARNAISHGLPLSPATLGSIRSYAEATSQDALDLAITSFIDATPGLRLVALERQRWSDRVARVGRGESWAHADAAR